MKTDQANEIIPSLREEPSFLQKKYNQVRPSFRGAVYIPPHKVAQLAIHPATNEEVQRTLWDSLKKNINGLINKVNTSNIQSIVIQLFNENINRGRGILARALIKAQLASPIFTNIYVALVAVINTKLPEVVQVLLQRVMLQFQRSFTRNNKMVCQASLKMLAHLINQLVLDEEVAFQLFVIFLENNSSDSIELACQLAREAGQVLSQLSPVGMNMIFDRLKTLLHQGMVSKNAQYSIQELFLIRRNEFKDFPGVIPELDLVLSQDQHPHKLEVTGQLNGQEHLNQFKFDPSYQSNQQYWHKIKLQILGQANVQELQKMKLSRNLVIEELPQVQRVDQPSSNKMFDMTEKELVNLRRIVYLTIQSTYDQQECCHKIIKLGIGRGHEFELAEMIIECCMMERIYQRFYGLLAERFCHIDPLYKDTYEKNFIIKYEGIDEQETNKIRNLGKLYAHLLITQAVSFEILAVVRLTEEQTTPSSRIFIKNIFKEMAETMGMESLRTLVNSKSTDSSMTGIFMRDCEQNTRFSINFFSSIGLGPLTDVLRDYHAGLLKSLEQQNERPQIEQVPYQIQKSIEKNEKQFEEKEEEAEQALKKLRRQMRYKESQINTQKHYHNQSSSSSQDEEMGYQRRIQQRDRRLRRKKRGRKRHSSSKESLKRGKRRNRSRSQSSSAHYRKVQRRKKMRMWREQEQNDCSSSQAWRRRRRQPKLFRKRSSEIEQSSSSSVN